MIPRQFISTETITRQTNKQKSKLELALQLQGQGYAIPIIQHLLLETMK
jgi:hypothetical protein